MGRFALCGVLLLAGPAFGQTKLAWKWKEGETFFAQTVTRVKQTLLVEGPRSGAPSSGAPSSGAPSSGAPRSGAPSANDREVRQAFEHTTLISYTVRKAEKDGGAVLVQKVERAAVKGPEATRTDEGVAGAELVLHVSPRGEVTKVEGHDKLLARLAGGDSGRRAVLAAALSEESLKRQATQALGLLPDGPAKKGQKWKQPAELDLGPLGRLKVEREYTCEDPGDKDKGVARFSFTTTVKGYEPGKGRSPAFQITRGQFKAAEGSGSLEFNAAAGRPVKATSTLKLQGELTMKNGDTEYRTSLTQEQTAETKVMDKRP